MFSFSFWFIISQGPATFVLSLKCSILQQRMLSGIFKAIRAQDFPGGAVVQNPPANAGDTGSSPGPGRSHMPQSS